MADERVDNQMLLDKLEGVMDRLEKSDPTDPSGMFGKSVKELSTSKDFKTLQKIVDENHERLTEDTEILKGDAATNKLANKVQIAKEIYDSFREHTASTFYKEQRKHNRGARNSRQKMENQNDLIIQDNKKIIELLKERKSGPLLAVGTGGGGQPDPSASDPDQQRINETVDRIEAKQFRLSPSEMRDAGYSKRESESEEFIDLEAHKRKDAAEKEKAAEEVKKKELKFYKLKGDGVDDAIKDETNLQKTRKKLYDEKVKEAGTNPLTGAQQYRDIETGQYTTSDEANWKTAELADAIRGGSGYAGGTTDRGASMASKGAATLSKNIGDNAPNIQRGLDELEKINAKEGLEAKQALEKLTKMMAQAASGEKDAKGKRVSADDVRQQAWETKLLMRRDSFGDTGEKLTEDLGLDQVSKDLSSERGFSALRGFIPLNKTGLKDFAGVDSDAGFGKGLKQAFSPERLFGVDKKTGPSFLGKVMNAPGRLFGARSIEDRVAEEKATQTVAARDQAKGLGTLIGEEGLDIATKDKKEEKAEDTKDAVEATAVTVETTAAKTEGIEKATERTAVATEELRDMAKDEGSLMVHDVHVEAKLDELLKEKEKKDGRTGQDTESIPERQLETLIDMRDLLEEATAGAALGMDRNSSGPGFFGRMFGRGGTPRGAPPGTRVAKPPGRMSRMFSKAGSALRGAGPAAQGFAQGSGGGILKGAARGLTRFGGAIAGVGMGVYEGVTGFRDAEARADAGELTAEEEQIEKGEAIGGGAGGAGGAIAGAAAGAAIGSVVPVIGTAIGGLIGGAVGYFAGRWAGKKAGGAIADAIPVSASELAESNELAETTLENVGEKDPELVTTIRQEADQIEAQMLEEAGDEVSDNDKAAIKNAALVKAIQNHTAEIDALPVTGGAQLTSQIEDEDSGTITTRTTQSIGGTFSERDLMENDPEAYAEFQEVKKQFRGQQGAHSKAIIEWGRMGRTEGFEGGTLERTQNGVAVPEGEEMEDLQGSIERGTLPTGDAIDNMTDRAGGGPTTEQGPVIVNNTVPAPAPTPPSDEPNIAIMPSRVRTSDSVIQRYQDKRFRV